MDPARLVGRPCLALLLFVAACGRSAMPANAPENATELTSATSAKLAPATPEVEAFLAPRADEAPADTSAIPGVLELTSEEQGIKAKCIAARDQALAKTTKEPFDGTRVNTALKALETADKRCLEIALREQTQASAKAKDLRARAQMQALARGLAKSGGACTSGSANPTAAMGACFIGVERFKIDREGWACMASALSPEDKALLDAGAAYVYSFTVDPKLGTFELVGHGCQTILGNAAPNAETELTVRGRIGDPSAAVVYRRAVPEKKVEAFVVEKVDPDDATDAN